MAEAADGPPPLLVALCLFLDYGPQELQFTAPHHSPAVGPPLPAFLNSICHLVSFLERINTNRHIHIKGHHSQLPRLCTGQLQSLLTQSPQVFPLQSLSFPFALDLELHGRFARDSAAASRTLSVRAAKPRLCFSLRLFHGLTSVCHCSLLLTLPLSQTPSQASPNPRPVPSPKALGSNPTSSFSQG